MDAPSLERYSLFTRIVSPSKRGSLKITRTDVDRPKRKSKAVQPRYSVPTSKGKEKGLRGDRQKPREVQGPRIM